jgi:murein DD-endopeptidase MepM/ murein hydrolase activator NlpD
MRQATKPEPSPPVTTQHQIRVRSPEVTVPERTGRGRRPSGERPAWRARRRWPRLALGLLLVPTVLLPTSVAADDHRSSSDIEREVEEAEQQERELEAELDGVRDELHEAEVELAEIGLRLEDARARLVAAEGQVQLAEAALEDAERERDEAIEAHNEAEELLARTEAELEAEEAKFKNQVVETFKYGTAGATRGAMVIEVLRRAEDPNDFAVGMKQLKVVVDDQDAVVQHVFDLREQRAEQADDAARARAEAAQAAADAEDMLRTVEALREEAAEVAAEVEHEEEQQQRVLASLQATEAETEELLERAAVRAAAREKELEEKRRQEEEERRRREEEARRKAEAEARKAAAASAGSGGGAEGGPMIDGMVCPVVGAVAGRDFSNDWGYPRSGGRTHKGNDIFASRGTSVVAVHDGTVTRWNPPSSPTRLGGITVTYQTADGSEWYNAHLDTIADGISPGASVERGQVIGTVGNTGNARTTPPHLHLGRRYGGSWVNPYPTISRVC